MKEDKVLNHVSPAQAVVQDTLTTFIRESANKMLKVAIEAEVQEFIATHQHLVTDDGKKRVVRNGYLPTRKISSGVGNIEVTVPRTRDRGTKDSAVEYEAGLVPKYMRKTLALEVMLPLLYLKGISTPDFPSILEPMLGVKPGGISSNVIGRLKESWYDEYQDWQLQDLSNKQYVYFWADGVYMSARMEEEKSCMLVIIGATACGKKELVAMTDGFRESKANWVSLLQDLRSRGLKSPRLGIGDGALGFWGALHEVYPNAKHQRCWLHKMRNILNKLPKSQQVKAKAMVREIYNSATKADAEKAIKSFDNTFNAKYPKTVNCLTKDQAELLAFYDFPAEHWIHLRTTNPIESTFATVRHRTKKSKNCFSRKTIVASTFKLIKEAEKRWKILTSSKKLADVINLVEFVDGVAQENATTITREEVAA